MRLDLLYTARLYGRRAPWLSLAGRGGENEEPHKYRNDKCHGRCRPEVIINYVIKLCVCARVCVFVGSKAEIGPNFALFDPL